MSVTQSDAAEKAVLDKDELRAIVAEILDLDVSDVSDDANFMEDLEVDSLMALEVVVVLEKRFGIKFAEAELRRITSLQEAYDMVTGKLRAQ
ncbi:MULTISPECIES: acyl carrier protein [unclassified Streptomyces]|uniref:acyl carrier protein n=1 Tax=unclassified Streptomyces TaxID=2593676 RepID=UPI0037B8BE93